MNIHDQTHAEHIQILIMIIPLVAKLELSHPKCGDRPRGVSWNDRLQIRHGVLPKG